VTRALSLDPAGQLLAGGPAGSRTIVLTTAAAPADRRAAVARHANVVVFGQDDLTPAAAIGALAERGYRRLLTEGGPRLLTQFTAAGLLDDLCLTISPVLEGGWSGRVLTAPEAASDGAPFSGSGRREHCSTPGTTAFRACGTRCWPVWRTSRGECARWRRRWSPGASSAWGWPPWPSCGMTRCRGSGRPRPGPRRSLPRPKPEPRQRWRPSPAQAAHGTERWMP